ncbi:hypothetical protein HPB48_015617 [Haemaphysalis longicornis]|uniref:Uncharacterized protein n=1 Tax=Haemaphysalis longicornis TaxID=44386 RepID=A0A9J6FHI2_HAELO|nr:hypothetical protein HPB48_015617 [Haemaphysalis longicornis]
MESMTTCTDEVWDNPPGRPRAYLPRHETSDEARRHGALHACHERNLQNDAFGWEATTSRYQLQNRTVQSLLKCKLLICREEKTKEYVKLRPDTVVSLFEGYDNKEVGVDINEPLEEELKDEKHVTQKRIDDGRKMVVQAAESKNT